MVRPQVPVTPLICAQGRSNLTVLSLASPIATWCMVTAQTAQAVHRDAHLPWKKRFDLALAGFDAS